MIKSMTGYGKAVCERSDKNILIEFKSLNSKGLDLSCRLPYTYKDKELELRALISERVSRGKVDFSIFFETNNAPTGKTINSAVVTGYYRQLSAIAAELGLPNGLELLHAVMKLPDTMSAETEAPAEGEWEAIQAAVQQALESFEQFRAQEGLALRTDLAERIRIIEACLDEIIPIEGRRVDKIRERIRKMLDDTIGSDKVDENRFEQELIFYLEKLDITEEKVRLRQHCKYFVETMDSDELAVGRKLNFIAQEIGREINTIGSKANDADVQKLVIQMKDELEKIKEQSLNIL